MSVTFSLSVKEDDFQGFEIYNLETDERHHATDYEHAKQVWDAVGATSQSWWTLSAKYSVSDEFDVQMSNTNARDVLEHLGITDEELCGSMSPDDMLGRCLVGSALVVDVELPAYSDTGSNGARLIDMGRAKGYVPAKLSAIMALCHEAQRLGRDVTWG
jgi:hypothetical protein